MDDREVPSAMHPQLGVCLRAARQARGLTLKQVAERTGMALIDLVEGREQPDVADLRQASAIDLRPENGDRGTVQSGEPAHRTRSVVTARRSISRAGQGQVVDTKFYTYNYQCTDLIGKKMVPIMAEVRARTLEEFGPLLRHAGEEYFLVTRGRIELHTEFYAPEILEEGDGVYLDSTMGHAYLNAGDEPAKGVCLCTSESPISTSSCARSRSGSSERTGRSANRRVG